MVFGTAGRCAWRGTLADWVSFLALPYAFSSSDAYALPSGLVPTSELVVSDC
jgi:hypothetical protein